MTYFQIQATYNQRFGASYHVYAPYQAAALKMVRDRFMQMTGRRPHCKVMTQSPIRSKKEPEIKTIRKW